MNTTIQTRIYNLWVYLCGLFIVAIAQHFRDKFLNNEKDPLAFPDEAPH